MAQMTCCDLLHILHKEVTNVSDFVFGHPIVGILTSPLKGIAIRSIDWQCRAGFLIPRTVAILPTGSEERGVLGVGSIHVEILPSCQDTTFVIQLHKYQYSG